MLFMGVSGGYSYGVGREGIIWRWISKYPGYFEIVPWVGY
jgi:hypothetical protein